MCYTITSMGVAHRFFLVAARIPPHLIEGLVLLLDVAPPQAHPIVWIRSMWRLAPRVNVDLSIVVVVCCQYIRCRR
jgi:hypothetical protein